MKKKLLYELPELMPPGAVKKGFTQPDIPLRLWLSYQIVTEEFDRQFPGAWSPYDRDAWIVCFRQDVQVSSRFAGEQSKYVRDTLRALGFPPADVEHARKEVQRLSYAECVQRLVYFDRLHGMDWLEDVCKVCPRPRPPADYIFRDVLQWRVDVADDKGTFLLRAA